MTGFDFNRAMIEADIASGKATVRSLAMLYMVAMANRHARGNLQDFADINTLISDHRKPNGTEAEKAMALEPVKKIAWELYEAVSEAATRTDSKAVAR
ncbi:hypothetical protein [Qipengyuania atrilutea]|uniref:Uncharacterized protein n=1 Tax=Qipengyuania atrilutea TaxID=2744473 RepID=A0A850H1G1_9SPHN|nr:hypothetical protein [Actirhodobacter atriluteus]NVD44360.1 hypothetical protein [Actirhodobacter atriluteus]